MGNSTRCHDYCIILTLVSAVTFVLAGGSQSVFAQSTQTFLTSGTFTVPVGVTSLTVQAWGGGGCSGNNIDGRARGGGGGGAFTGGILTVVPGSIITITVGAGGIYNSAATANDDGGASIVGVLIANGGSRGVIGNNSVTINGGAGGAASANPGGVTSFLSFSGGNGGNGFVTANKGGGGGGGESASPTGVGNAGANGTSAGTGGVGGAGGTGNATGGDGGRGADNDGNPNSSDGVAPGGGGGGRGDDNGNDRNGGAGKVILIWPCPIFSLTATMATSVCSGNASVVTLSSSASGLPVGTYTVTYNLSGANTATGATSVFTVNTAGSATFNTSVLANGGATSITITNLASAGCTNAISANNTANITVGPLPAQPGIITGNATPCAGISQIYSVTNVTGVTYTWTVPVGWVITAGNGTTSITVTTGTAGQNGNITVTAGNTCGNSSPSTLAVTVSSLPAQTSAIAPVTPEVCQNSVQNYMVNPPAPVGVTYTWTGPAGSTILSGQGTNLIQIRFGNTSGTLTITPSNSCGNGPSQSMAITVLTSVPAQPGLISGPIAPCTGTTQVFTVPLVSGLTYSWSVPVGWSITAGQGTNTISALVGASAGNIQVSAGNVCGGSAPRLLAVTPQAAAPAQPSPITGNAQVCLGSSQTYSVTNVAFVTYTWSVPAGWSIVSGQGTNSINVTVGAAAGTISVTPSNDCGVGPPRTLAVIVDAAIPVDPGPVAGNATPCESSSQVYSVTNQSGVSYAWTIPAGSIITAGQGTYTITVTIGITSGSIQVTPTNSCGTGPVKTLNITVSPLPASSGTITGSILFCEGTTQIYSVTNVAGITYNWSVPAGWAINSGQGTNSIQATTGVTSGNVQVTPVNACGPGPTSTLAVTVNPLPAAFAGTNKEICAGASVQIGGPAVPGNTYSWTSVPVGFTSILSDPVVTPDVTTVYTLVETNTATGCSNTHSVTVVANQVIDVFATPDGQTICTGGTTSIVLSSNISYTTFTWEPVLTSGSGTSGFSDGAGPLIAQTITNTSAAPSVVTYTIEATANECVNYKKSVVITINPAPVVNGATTSLCSNTPVGLSLGASTNGVPAATYTITNIQNNGLTASAGSPATGSGLASNVIADDAWTNTTLNPVHVIYSVVPVSALGCSGALYTIDVTVNPKPEITNLPTKEICSGTSTSIALTANITSTFSWTIGTITGGITGASASSGNTINQVLTNPVNTTAGTVQYVITPVSTTGTCTGSTFTITVTVNPLPVVTNAATYNVCSGTNTNLALTSSTPSGFSWTIGTITGSIAGATPSSGTTISQVLSNPSNAVSGTVQYIVTPTATAGGCVGSAFTIIITVDPIPTVSAGATPNAVCPGVPFNLNSSSSLVWSSSIILEENFNGAATWSSTGTPVAARWALQSDGFPFDNLVFHSNDNSQFYFTRSRNITGATNTYLQSPLINTIGFASLSLDFHHYYRHGGSSAAKVQVSTNSTTWTDIKTYSATKGSANAFEPQTLDLSAYKGNDTLYIRFYYSGNNNRYWAIDNVTLQGTETNSIPIITWTSNPAGFNSTEANPANVNQTETSTYTVSYKNPFSGCSTSASTTVTNLALPNAAITVDYCVQPECIQLTASGGQTYLWNTVPPQTTPVICVDQAGVYSVTVTGANGCVATAFLNASNELVTNGTFNAGNTGYITDYGYIADNAGQQNELWPEGLYSVGTDAFNYHTDFFGKDRTNPGTGKFMIVNGLGGSLRIWQQTVAVEPNRDYYFSAWAMSLNDAGNYARLQFEVNGVPVGTIAELGPGPADNTEVSPTNWVRFYSTPTWPSGAANTAVIRIINLRPELGGNDFGLDDISFGTLSPVPFSFKPSGNIGYNDSICEGQNLELFANITGGMPPYVTQWSGPNGFTSTLLNPVIPYVTNAAEGNYTLAVHDSYGCASQVESVFITVNPAPTATISGSGNYCQYGASPLITFTANGGEAPYTFTYTINGGANQTVTTYGTSNTAIVFAPTVLLGTYTYTLVSVTDDLGCARTINSSVTVVVNGLPVSSFSGNNPVCPGSSGNIYTGNTGMASYTWWISGNGSIPGVSNLNDVNVTAGNSCGFPFTLDLEITDSNGCSALAEEAILVDDDANPVIISCPPAVVYTGTDVTSITPLPYSETPSVISEAEYITAGGSATDNCAIDTYSYTDVQNGTSPIIVTRTFKVTDKCGNITTCTQIITINNFPPDITCISPAEVYADAGICSTVINPAEPTVNGGGPVTWSWVMSGATTGSGTGAIGDYTFNAGVTTISWTATNVSGTDVCDQTITVIDNQPPSFNAPAIGSGYCVEGFLVAVYKPGGVYYVDDLTPVRRDYHILTAGNTLLDIASLTDNCTGPILISWTIDFGNNGTVDLSGNGQISLVTPINFPLGDNLVTWTVTDAAGNTAANNVIFKVLPRPTLN